jgi:hypothetical protein
MWRACADVGGKPIRRRRLAVSPTWPTAVPLEGTGLACGVKTVAWPGPGSDLTIAIQT